MREIEEAVSKTKMELEELKAERLELLETIEELTQKCKLLEKAVARE